MSKTAWIVFAVLCVALLGGLVWAAQSNRLDVSDVNPWTVQTAQKRNGEIADHVLGNPNAKVTMIEFGDFECPGCGDFYPVEKQIMADYSDQIRFIFRNFPLSTIHPNARAGAAAAEAAGLQGKYWQMHDELYANQDQWVNLSGQQRTDVFAGYATSLGLDKAKFIADLDSPNVLAKINFDVAVGDKLGLDSTPSIFVDGKAADQYVHDGKLVSTQQSSSDNLVWASATTMEDLLINPALEKAGVPLPKISASASSTATAPSDAVAAPSQQ